MEVVVRCNTAFILSDKKDASGNRIIAGIIPNISCVEELDMKIVNRWYYDTEDTRDSCGGPSFLHSHAFRK